MLKKFTQFLTYTSTPLTPCRSSWLSGSKLHYSSVFQPEFHGTPMASEGSAESDWETGNKPHFAATKRVFWALSASKMHLRSGPHPELRCRSLQLAATSPRTPFLLLVFSLKFYDFHLSPWWLDGVVVSLSDSWLRGRGFDSRPAHHQATTLGKLLTPTCLCHQAVQFTPGR